MEKVKCCDQTTVAVETSVVETATSCVKTSDVVVQRLEFDFGLENVCVGVCGTNSSCQICTAGATSLKELMAHKALMKTTLIDQRKRQVDLMATRKVKDLAVYNDKMASNDALITLFSTEVDNCEIAIKSHQVSSNVTLANLRLSLDADISASAKALATLQLTKIQAFAAHEKAVIAHVESLDVQKDAIIAKLQVDLLAIQASLKTYHELMSVKSSDLAAIMQSDLADQIKLAMGTESKLRASIMEFRQNSTAAGLVLTKNLKAATDKLTVVKAHQVQLVASFAGKPGPILQTAKSAAAASSISIGPITITTT